jgi:hypothetical protein
LGIDAATAMCQLRGDDIPFLVSLAILVEYHDVVIVEVYDFNVAFDYSLHLGELESTPVLGHKH